MRKLCQSMGRNLSDVSFYIFSTQGNDLHTASLLCYIESDFKYN